MERLVLAAMENGERNQKAQEYILGQERIALSTITLH
jgi:hypothetical protein